MRNVQIIKLTEYRIAINVVAALTLSGPMAHAQGAIAGTVVDAAGEPVAGASVYYNNVPPLSAKGQLIGQPIGSKLQTGADGTFSISGLPPGYYRVCARGIAVRQLASCEWGLPLATLILTRGRHPTR
jgi:hypothetical protein